jgi:hypothetical protein
MRNDVEPSACLPCEPEAARSLQWLPWAVRYKLDGASLKLSLSQWQALDPETRKDLVRRLPADGFEALARRAGARNACRPGADDPVIDAADLAPLLGCDVEAARTWFAGASSFARYAMGKRVALGACEVAHDLVAPGS